MFNSLTGGKLRQEERHVVRGHFRRDGRLVPSRHPEAVGGGIRRAPSGRRQARQRPRHQDHQ